MASLAHAASDKQARHMANSQCEPRQPPTPGALGMDLAARSDRGPEPSAARLDEQLRFASVFSLQPALVCRQHLLHLRTRLFAGLLLAVLMPAILGLADREIGVRRPQFRGRGWAIFALCFAVVLGMLALGGA